MSSASRLIVLATIAGLFAWLMADALFGSGMFVFRDAAHYYYPLFQFIAEEWAAGRVPLWNPYENLGVPLAGNAASSVFYPGKLIFALPLDYAWAYKLYIIGHLLVAAAAAYRLARHWNASVEATGICAISYAFSGNVLFDYCNVVFLVGAAWLPVAILSADRMLREGPGARGEGRAAVRWAVAFGAVLALMVLGGDPQMAYNAGLLAAMYALWLWWHESPLSLWERVKVRVRQAIGCVQHTTRQGGEDERRSSAIRLLRCTYPTRPALLALAAATGLVLSAVQVLPSIEFARLSGRASGRLSERLLCRIEPGTHSEHIYHFSVGPWRLAEYVWPNVGGRQFPIHRRWLEVVPAEGRIWTPSLYMGLLPLLLALAALRLRRGKPRDCWLSWSVVLAVLASFGWYGLGWLMEEIRIAAGGDPPSSGVVGAPFGGLYWLMTVLLPGYAYFRYPAKLLVVAALGLSLLAARGWDRTVAEPSRQFGRWLLWLGGLSACGAIAALAIRPFWHGWLSGVKPDMLFGPLDTSGAADDLLGAFVQTAVLCGLFWWLLRRAASGARWVPAVVLVLVAVDLAVANRWMVVCAPASQWQGRSELAAVLRKRGQAPFSAPKTGADPFFSQPYRVSRHPPWMRPEWKASGSPRRLADAMRWDLDTLWPKYNLADRIPLAEVRGTMAPYDYQVLLSAKRGQTPFSLSEYVILPGDDVLSGGEPVDVGVDDVSLWHNPQHLPRTWIVHQVDVLPPIGSHDSAELRRRTEEVLHREGRRRDLRRSAVVEVSGRTLPALGLNTNSPRRGNAGQARPPGDDSCRVVHYDPLHVEINAELARPGLVVLCDQFYPGWKLEVKTARQPSRLVPILRANRVMRGAWLPAGQHRLVFRYLPTSFICGATISGLGWIGIVLGLGWRLKGRRVGSR